MRAAVFARAELVLLAPLLGIPLFRTFRARPWSRRFAIVGSIAVGTAILIGPWIAYNFSRFDEPTFLSTNDGTAMLASNCDNVFWGPSTGLTYLRGCIPVKAPPGDQSVVSRIYRDRAFDYVSCAEARRSVLLARIGRDWSLFRPVDMLAWNQREGRASWITGLGLFFYYPLLALAIGGIVVLKRRRIRQWPLLIPPIIVTLGTVLAYGQTRFRVPAEPTIVVLAAVALTALSHRWWPEASPPAPPSSDDAPDDDAFDQVAGVEHDRGELLELIHRTAGVLLQREQALVEEVDVVLPREADATEHLDRARAHLVERVGRERLGHGGGAMAFGGVGRVAGPGRVVRGSAGELDRPQHVRAEVLDRLEGPDRDIELLALAAYSTAAQRVTPRRPRRRPSRRRADGLEIAPVGSRSPMAAPTPSGRCFLAGAVDGRRPGS